MMATRDALSQPKDGHTLLLCTHFEGINVAVDQNPRLPLDEIAPISLISKYFSGITVSQELPVDT